MRVVIAQMKHETNTFSPVKTPIDRFSRGVGMPREGADAGLDYALPIAASAWPDEARCVTGTEVVVDGGHQAHS